MQMFRSSKCQC